MKISTLTAKLQKLGIETTVKSYNDFNKSLRFVLNGRTVHADFTVNRDEFYTFAVPMRYNDSEQQMDYIFCKTWPQLIRFTS